MSPEYNELDDEEVEERTPNVHMSDEDVEALPVEYSIRAPGDWVISGPLGAHGHGPGRHFPRIRDAEEWVRGKYGDLVRWRIKEASRSTNAGLGDPEMRGGNRWAYLIKPIPPKGAA